jgi:hypothetical protein
MRKLLLQLDSSRLPSAFDRIVAFDAGADEVLSYGGVNPSDAPDLIRGAIFTRGPQDLRNTAVFIGGTDVAAGEELLAAARSAMFGPFRVSMMLDANGANTTAVAAVTRITQTLGDVRGRHAVVLAGTGPVGRRVAGLLAKAGAQVTITSRRAPDGASAQDSVVKRFGGSLTTRVVNDPSQASAALEGVQIVVAAGPPGVRLVPRSAWFERKGVALVIDLNAVPPTGIDGVDVGDNAVRRGETVAFGALGVGGLKMKLHKACVARLFERNDVELDVETIADLARDLFAPREAQSSTAPAPQFPAAREQEMPQR